MTFRFWQTTSSTFINKASGKRVEGITPEADEVAEQILMAGQCPRVGRTRIQTAVVMSKTAFWKLPICRLPKTAENW